MKQLRVILSIALTLFLLGCGGGGGSAGGSTGGSSSSGGTSSTTNNGSLVVSIVSTATSGTVSGITTAGVFKARATLKDGAGAPVAFKLVSFASGDSRVILDVTTQLTDAQGVADVSIAPATGASAGAATLSATSLVGTNTFTGLLDYSFTAGASAPISTVTANATPAAVEILLSGNTISSSAAGNVLVTALVKSAGNVGLANQTVTFSSTSGVLQFVSTATNAIGVATANLSPGADKSNRNVTVTVAAGPIVNNIAIPVVGSNLALAGAGAMLAGKFATYTVKATDGSGSPVSSASIRVVSALGNSVSPAVINTDATGNATFNYVANVAGNDTLSITGLGTTASTAVAVSSEDFAFSTPSAGSEIVVNTNTIVSVQYKSGGLGVSGKTVTFSTTRGTVSPSLVVTDANGFASTTLNSTTAGPADINAQIAGLARANLGVSFVALDPANIFLQINPSALQPNAAGSSASKANLIATVRDAAGNPVKNRTVNFTADLDGSGGSITSGTSQTDANGVATGQFISGAVATAANGVILRATVANTQLYSTASMSINSQALFINMAFGKEIGQSSDLTRYVKDYSVYVTDATGAAVANQAVQLAVYPTAYIKGSMTFVSDPLNPPTGWRRTGILTACANEDINRSGQFSAALDINGDGKLTPGLPAVVSPGTVTTDASGFATFSVIYGKQYALWLVLELTARANVSGTESSSTISFLAPVSSADVGDSAISPPNQISPFGYSNACTNSN